MSKYAGKDLLIQKGDGGSPEGFNIVAHLRSKSFSINNEPIDVTDSDDSRWRKLLEGGVRTCSLSGSGLLTDVASHDALLTDVFAGTIASYRVIFAGTQRSLTGRFLPSNLEGSGEYTDAQQFSLTLESAGDITLVLP